MFENYMKVIEKFTYENTGDYFLDKFIEIMANDDDLTTEEYRKLYYTIIDMVRAELPHSK